MNTNRLWGKLKWLGILWILWHCAGCDREYLQYDTGKKDNIYMNSGDSAYYSFISGAPDEEYDYPLFLQVMGMPKPYVRSYRIEVIDSLTTARADVHYRLRETDTFPREVISTTRYITLFKNKDPELRERPVVLAFKLVETDDFSVVPIEKRYTKMLLFISITATPKPWWWSDSDLGSYTEQAAYMFMHFFHEVKQKNPVMYERLTSQFGPNLEWGNYRFWNNNRIAIHKYIIRPLYDYYRDRPDPEVNIPEPQY